MKGRRPSPFHLFFSKILRITPEQLQLVNIMEITLPSPFFCREPQGFPDTLQRGQDDVQEHRFRSWPRLTCFCLEHAPLGGESNRGEISSIPPGNGLIEILHHNDCVFP